MSKHANLREERLQREQMRFENMESQDVKAGQVLAAKRDFFNAGKKNQGGAAYNLISLNYD